MHQQPNSNHQPKPVSKGNVCLPKTTFGAAKNWTIAVFAEHVRNHREHSCKCPSKLLKLDK